MRKVEEIRREIEILDGQNEAVLDELVNEDDKGQRIQLVETMRRAKQSIEYLNWVLGKDRV